MGGEVKQQGLKLKQLAKPLKEARKDPRVEKAVLFVEDLFGKELRSRHDILLVNERNKKEYVEAVKEDSEKLERLDYTTGKPKKYAFFSPALCFFYSDEKIRKILHGIDSNTDWVIVRPKDLLKPLLKPVKFVRENVYLGVTAPRMLEQIGSEDDLEWMERAVSNKIVGLHIGNENLIILGEEFVPSGGLVHELIHAEDNECLDKTNPLYYVLTEGRATFGESIFTVEESGIPTNTLEILVGTKMKSMFGNGGIIQRNLNYLRDSLKYIGGKPGMLARLDAIIRNLLKEIKSTSIEDQRTYIPFTIALAELAHTLKDPYAAFRITTDKQPRTIEDIKNVKEFYKKEIEEYGSLN